MGGEYLEESSAFGGLFRGRLVADFQLYPERSEYNRLPYEDFNISRPAGDLVERAQGRLVFLDIGRSMRRPYQSGNKGNRSKRSKHH
ncbi:hypothetical protein HY26_10790 [Hyphomonas sp. GM-8P]|nr:hypothetical protein HY26_10790 [Hyphomonas sp. GM-8P]